MSVLKKSTLFQRGLDLLRIFEIFIDSPTKDGIFHFLPDPY